MKGEIKEIIMNNRIFKLIFSLTLLSVLFMIAGCGGGGGQSVLTQESPEAAVMRISNSWRTTNSSPQVVVDSANRFVRQARADEEPPTPGQQQEEQGQGADTTGRTITLYDLASNTYELKVLSVVKTSDINASVKCSFLYGADGYLSIIFSMDFDESKWWITNVVITDEPLGEGESIYYTYHIGLSTGAEPKETVLNDDTIKSGRIGDEVSITPNSYQSYEFIEGYKNNVSTGTITPADKPLVLKLYYQEVVTAGYTVYHVKRDANGVDVATETEKLYAKVDSEVTYINPKVYEGYEYLSSESSVTGKVAADGSLELFLFYQYNEKTSYSVKCIDVDTENELSDYSYVVKSETIGKRVKITPVDVTGYYFVGKEEDLIKDVLADGKLVITLYYKTRKTEQRKGRCSPDVEQLVTQND